MRRQKNVLRKSMHNRVNGFTINIDFCGKDKQTFQHRMHRLERLTVTFQNSILHFEFTFPTPLVKTPINWLQSYNGKKLRLCLEVILLYPRVQYNSKQNMASFLRVLLSICLSSGQKKTTIALNCLVQNIYTFGL